MKRQDKILKDGIPLNSNSSSPDLISNRFVHVGEKQQLESIYFEELKNSNISRQDEMEIKDLNLVELFSDSNSQNSASSDPNIEPSKDLLLLLNNQFKPSNSSRIKRPKPAARRITKSRFRGRHFTRRRK